MNAPRIAALGLALTAAACATTEAGGGGTLYGAASCQASARGACPEVNGKTLYQRRNADLFYFAPDGFVHSVRGTRVVRERWRVSSDGRNLITAGGFGGLGIPLATMANVYRTIPGDPVGLARRDGVAVRLSGEDARPFPAIAAELRG